MHDRVERARPERQRRAVGDDGAASMREIAAAGARKRVDKLMARQIGEQYIAARDLGDPASRPASPGAEVEHEMAGAKAEAAREGASAAVR